MTPNLRFRQVPSRRCHVLLPVALGCLGALLPAPLRAGPVPADKPAHFPAWWFERDVIVRTNPGAPAEWANNYPKSDDFAAVTEGQLKAITAAAVAELNSRLPDVADATGVSDGAGRALNELVATWNAAPAPGVTRNDYGAVNLGQLKSITAMIYERLIATGYYTQLPWAGSSGASDYSTASLGQLKNLYSFDVSGFTHDVWTGIGGTDIGSIPTTHAPGSPGYPGSTVTNLDALENGDAGDDYGERLRGYLTVPVTGVHRFWLTASGSAQLFISNDDEPVNVFLRAEVKPTTASTMKSTLMWLEAGQRYYFEVLHKAGTGVTDHLSVGWLKASSPTPHPDPDSVTAPTEVVPLSAISRRVGSLPTPFVPPAPPSWALPTDPLHVDHHAQRNAATRFLIQATFGPSGWYDEPLYGHCGAAGHGTAHEDHGLLCTDCGNTCAGHCTDPSCTYTITYDPPGSPPPFTYHPAYHKGVHGDACGGWAKVTGSGEPTIAGPSQLPYDVREVQSLGYGGWIDNQFNLPATKLYPYVQAVHGGGRDDSGNQYWHTQFYRAWWRTAITSRDQLRQRVAFALSQIMVVGSPALNPRSDTCSAYYDQLVEHAFTEDFRDLLKAVTLEPAMGLYLNMHRNDKPLLDGNGAVLRAPNENYARELLQLFSIGLNRMNPDGTLIKDSAGQPIPTYDQPTVEGLAHVLTGWGWHYYGTTLRTTFDMGDPYYYYTDPDLVDIRRRSLPMREVPARHYTGQKRILNNVVLPGMPKYLNSSSQLVTLDPHANHAAIPEIINPTNSTNAKFNALAEDELDAVIDAIVANPNCGPFICRQLIQRLVTSHPSDEYVYRVTSKFNDDGSPSHKRGNMKAVIKAILLDRDARASSMLTNPSFGKQREPVCRITAFARAFPSLETPTWTSTWDVGQTSFVAPGQTNLNQTPLGAPSVFNFYRPDYKFPGKLAQEGLTTPEFQITTATSVLDQANAVNGPFLSWGSPGGGKVAFPAGYLKTICMDLGLWQPASMNNTDLPGLVSNLNHHLMAGQLPSTGTNSYYPTRVITNPTQAIIDTISTKPISAISAAGTPVTITTSVPHCLSTGDRVFFSHSMGCTFTPTLSQGWPTLDHVVTVTGANTFTIPVQRTDTNTPNLSGATVSLLAYDSTLNRVYYAVNLMLNSPDFIIQR